MNSGNRRFLRLSSSILVAVLSAGASAGADERELNAVSVKSTRQRHSDGRRKPCSADFFGLYDDFDGRGAMVNGTNLALAGGTSAFLWDHASEVSTPAAYTDNLDEHGNVLVLRLGPTDRTWKTYQLVAPQYLPVDDLCAVSADVLLPANAPYDSSLSLKVVAEIGSPLNRWWEAGIAIFRNSEGAVGIGAYHSDLNAESDVWHGTGGEVDRWYNFRIQISRVDSSNIRLEYYLDGFLFYSTTSSDGEILLDPSQNRLGIRREITINQDFGLTGALGLVDNVRGAYAARVENQAPMYDDFDGHGGRQPDGTVLAEPASTAANLWSSSGEVVDAEAEVANHENRGYVLRLSSPNRDDGWKTAILSNPWSMPHISDVGTMSGSFLVPSDSAVAGTGAGLHLSVSSSLLPKGWWSARIGIEGDSDAEMLIVACVDDVTGDGFCVYRGADPDTWYDLRMDAAAQDDGAIRIDFLVNDIPFASLRPEGGGLLSQVGGIERFVFLWNNIADQEAVVLVDGVRAVYAEKVLNSFPLYDDFDGNGGELSDGHNQAVPGVATGALWSGTSSVSVVPAPDHLPDAETHGNVMKFDSTRNSDVGFKYYTTWLEYGSFSADFLVSSESSTVDCSIALDNHSAMPEVPPGKSSYIQIGMRLRDTNFIYVFYNNINTGCSKWLQLDSIDFDTWYNLRMDIVVVEDSEIRLETYVNGFLRTSEVLCDGMMHLYPNPLLDASLWAGHTPRHIQANCVEGDLVVYMDNVRAVYEGMPPVSASEFGFSTDSDRLPSTGGR